MNQIKADISVIILTYNEEIHIERCIKSALKIANRICIVDSFSNDNTFLIANQFKIDFYQNKFINQANQFQWALNNCNINTEWVLKLDADEYFTDDLINEITIKLPLLPDNISGIYFNLRQYYLDKWIKFGGRYPLKLLRLWKFTKGIMEQRLMDEHIKITEGESISFKHDFIHDNLNTLTWMISKHNNYAIREAIAQLNEEFNLSVKDEFLDKKQILKNSTHRTRFFKNVIYSKRLLLFRSLLYFLYRYFILFGFLDGKEGLIYHFLQGFWYRFLVDAKIIEIKHLALKKGINIMQAIEDYSGYKIN
jgi:glycosyltransferase involved in cell wall biosynthesis